MNRHTAGGRSQPPAFGSAEPLTEQQVQPGPAEQQPTASRPEMPRALREFLLAPWPLFAVLAVQGVLSLRLIWGNTAFIDEGTYIWAGRVELWHLTTGTSVPLYSSYFSGAPVIYPPLAGLADIVGGLVAARLLSLAFMLGVTCMLWGTTRSLCGQRAAICAIAVFASIGSTQFLGSLATFDAMALFLLTMSARLVIAARDRGIRSPLLVAAIAALVLANATKYATGIFDPVIVILAALTSPRGLKAGLIRAAYITAATAGLIAILLAIGGQYYLQGLKSTTLSRPFGTDPASVILEDSAHWVGLVVILSATAVLIACWLDRRQALLFAVLMAAGLLVPANQTRIHTLTSLLKHVDFGAWFACIAAGYALAVVSRFGRSQWVRGSIAVATGVIILVPVGAIGRAQAESFNQSWVNTAGLVAELRVLVKEYHGVYLAEDDVAPAYYLENQVPYQDWQSTWHFGYRPPGSSTCVTGSITGAFELAVQHRYFSLIMLSFTDTTGVDHAIENDIARFGGYQVVAVIPFTGKQGQFIIWGRIAGEAGSGSAC